MSCLSSTHLTPELCCSGSEALSGEAHSCWNSIFTQEKCCGHNEDRRLWLSVGDPTCWSSGFSREQCCGDPDDGACWDDEGLYSFERCCGSVVTRSLVNFSALVAMVRIGKCSRFPFASTCTRLWRSELPRAESLKDEAVQDVALLLARRWRDAGLLEEAAQHAPAVAVSIALHAALALVDEWVGKNVIPSDLWGEVSDYVALYPAHLPAIAASDVTTLRIGALDDALRHRVHAHYSMITHTVLSERLTQTDQESIHFHDILSHSFSEAFQELIEVLDDVGIEYVPIQGTLISLLRYGTFPAGRLGSGKRDVVDNDAEVMVILPEGRPLIDALRTISLGLEARGWPPCFYPHPRKGVCFSLRHAVPCKLELYFVSLDNEADAIFAERTCAEDGDCEYHLVFPFQSWGGRMPLDVVYPRSRCRTGADTRRQARCPHRPLELLRGWNQGEYQQQSKVSLRNLKEVQEEAPCPAGGLDAHGRCWFLSATGESCSSTCEASGLRFVWAFIREGVQPMTPQLLNHTPEHQQAPWMPLECYVAEQDRFHIALEIPQEDSVDWGTWRYPACRLSCPCETLADAGPIRSGSCMALPVLSADRDKGDSRNLRLQAEGLNVEDLRLLHGYARGLHSQGFASFHTHLREAPCRWRQWSITAGDAFAGLSTMHSK